jgi:hypothetical protein
MKRAIMILPARVRFAGWACIIGWAFIGSAFIALACLGLAGLPVLAGDSATEAPSSASILVPAPEPLGPPATDLLALPVSMSTHPNDDIVILYRGVTISLGPDGRVSRRYRIVQRLLTDFAVSVAGDPRVAYDTIRQDLSIHACRTFMLDGKEVVSTPHAFNLVTPERVASCPDKVGLQEMVISYLGVERGCMTELDYTVADRIPWRPWLDGSEDLGDGAPILRGEIRIHADGLQAEIATNVPLPNVDGDEKTGTWRYGPLPGYPPEGGQTARERIPHLVYSTCPSMDALTAWIGERLDRAAAPDSAIDAWALEPLASGRPPLNDDEKWQRVAHLVAERTRSCEDSPLFFRLPIQAAARTFDSSRGNLLDRAALAWAALRAYGIEIDVPKLAFAESAFEMPTGMPPTLSCFDDIIFLGKNGGALSVARGSSSISAATPPWGGVEISTGGRESHFRLGTDRSDSEISVRIHEDEDGSIRGDAWVWIRRDRRNEEGFADVKRTLESLASSVTSGGKLAGYSLQRFEPSEFEATFSFTAAALGESLGHGRRLVRIPSDPGVPDQVFPDGLSFRRATRTNPIVFPFLGASEKVTMRLELSSKSRAVILPATDTVKEKVAVLETSVSRDGTAILVSRRFEITSIPRHRVDPDQYSGLRAAVLGRIAEPRNGIVIERQER